MKYWRNYASRVITLLKDKNSYGHVRNKGALSVFAIPDEGGIYGYLEWIIWGQGAG